MSRLNEDPETAARLSLDANRGRPALGLLRKATARTTPPMETEQVFKRILVASDLTVLTEPALRLAATLAKDNLASGVVLNVAEEPQKAGRWLASLLADEVAHLRAFRTRHEAAALELLANQVRAVEATFDCLVRWGDPAETIAAEAGARGVDLVILGSRGPLLGSVAERVLRIADRPVLVVPGVPPGHPRLGVRRA